MLLYVFVSNLAPAGVRPPPSTDFDVYYLPVSEQILSGEGVTTPGGSAALLHAPGFPVVLAVVRSVGRFVGTSTASSVAAMSAGAFAATGVMLHRLHRKRFGRRIAALGLVAFAAYPITWWTFLSSNVEVLFAPLVAAVAMLTSERLLTGAVRPRHLVVLGGLVGLSGLVRPNGLLLAVPVIVALVMMRSEEAEGTNLRRVIVQSMVVIGVAGAVVAPWIAWASGQEGRFIPLTTSGPATVQAGLEVGSGRSEESGSTWIAEPARRFARDAASEPGHTMGDVVGRAIGRAARAPGDGVAMAFSKATRAWYGTESFESDRLLLAIQLPVGALVVAGLVLIRRSDRSYVAFLVSLLVVFWATAVVFLSIVRFVTPAALVAVWLAPVGPLALVAQGRRRRELRLSAAGPSEAPPSTVGSGEEPHSSEESGAGCDGGADPEDQ